MMFAAAGEDAGDIFAVTHASLDAIGWVAATISPSLLFHFLKTLHIASLADAISRQKCASDQYRADKYFSSPRFIRRAVASLPSRLTAYFCLAINAACHATRSPPHTPLLTARCCFCYRVFSLTTLPSPTRRHRHCRVVLRGEGFDAVASVAKVHCSRARHALSSSSSARRQPSSLPRHFGEFSPRVYAALAASR